MNANSAATFFAEMANYVLSALGNTRSFGWLGSIVMFVLIYRIIFRKRK